MTETKVERNTAVFMLWWAGSTQASLARMERISQAAIKSAVQREARRRGLPVGVRLDQLRGMFGHGRFPPPETSADVVGYFKTWLRGAQVLTTSRDVCDDGGRGIEQPGSSSAS